MKMKKKSFYAIFLFSLISLFSLNLSASNEVVSVNSIAPDKGLADPHVWIVNDTLYAMCGHDKTWNTTDFCHMDKWELWSTTNLKDWKHVLDIKPTQTYIGDNDNCWAGDLAEKNGKFYWYFSNRNFSTGVMTAPSMKGPWKDALGKPLLPNDIIPSHHPYDPEIYVENGVFTIFFGAGKYYAATLNDDMVSLKSKPLPIEVLNEDGSRHANGDKSCVFKRGDWYYLCWGNVYSMSKNLYGPYTYKGAFLDGGHGSVFKWHGQWYSIQENHETNAFYRGVQLRPLFFNEDSTVKIPKVNYEYPFPGRVYDFKHSTQGWRGIKDTEVTRDKHDYIEGKVDGKDAIIASTPFLHTDLNICNNIYVKLKSESKATKFRVAIYTYGADLKPFTRKAPQIVDWSKEDFIDIPYKKLNGGVQSFEISLSAFKGHKQYLHQIAVQPICDAKEGKWELLEVSIK